MRQGRGANGLGEVVQVAAEGDPLSQHVSTVWTRKREGIAYANKQCRQSRNDCEREEERDGLGRALGVGAEDVADLVPLAVAEGLLVRRRRDIRVGIDLDLKYGLVYPFSETKGGEDNGCLERLGSDEELDREVLVRLVRVVSNVSQQ